MRPLLLLPLLLLTLACGPSRLSRREAENDLRKDYPVTVAVEFRASAKAVKGSPEHAKLLALEESLTKTGWFTAQRAPAGDRESFTFQATAAAPKTLRATAEGFRMAAAEADFVRAIRLDSNRATARVTYQIRLVRPTPFFGIFQALHPTAHLGDTHGREATYRREGRAWILQGTNETFKKAE